MNTILMKHSEPSRTYTIQKASVSVNKIAKQHAGKDWELYADLIKYWDVIVGKDLSKCTYPVNISFPYQPSEQYRKNGTLTIKLPKGLAMEFSFKLETIKQKINRYIGYTAFTNIKLENCNEYVLTPKHESKLSDADINDIKQLSSEIDDPELRAAIENLGLSLKKTAVLP